VRRRLSSLTVEELELVELVAAATHIADWKLVGRILEDSLGVLSAEEVVRLDRWVTKRLEDHYARQVFHGIMRGEPGFHIAQVKKRSTGRRGANLPRATEPDGSGSDGPGDHLENKETTGC